MRAPADWEIVGGDPAPGDPSAFEEVAQFFGDTATNAMEAQARLRRLVEGTDETIWRGPAADAFREDVGKLPERLDKLYQSYNSASEALRIYGVSLRQLQARAGTEIDKAIAADQEQAAYIENLVSSAAGTAPTPPPVGPGPPAPDPTESARARLAAAQAEIERIRQERETAEAKAIGALDHAGDIGIHNQSRWSRISGWVGDQVERAADFYHKSLRVIGDLADRISVVLTIITAALLVVAFVAAPFTGGASLALMPLAATLGQISAGAGLISVGAKVQSKALFNDSDLSWGSLALDGTLAVAGFVGPGVALRGAGGMATRASQLGPVARMTARVGEGLATFAVRPGVQRMLVHTRRIGDALERAQPLYDDMAAGASRLWQAAGPAGQELIKMAAWDGPQAVRSYWGDPSLKDQLLGPIQTGPAVVTVPAAATNP